MSLKMKLTSTICAFFLILGLVIMGVFASPQASVNLGGTITFHATDVYANVYGSITGAVESETAGGTLSLTTLNFEAGETTDTSSWANVPLTFNDNGGMITISITIENLATDRPLYATINDNYGAVTNVTKGMKKGEATYTGDCLTIPQKSGDDTNKVTINLTMEVKDKNFSLTDGLRYGYIVDLSNEEIEVPVVRTNSESLGTVTSSVTDGVLTVEVQPQEGAQFVGFRKTASGTLTTSAISSEQEFLNLNIIKYGALSFPMLAVDLGFDETVAMQLMSQIAQNTFMDYSIYLEHQDLVNIAKQLLESIPQEELESVLPGLTQTLNILVTGDTSYTFDYVEGDKYQAVFSTSETVENENGYNYAKFPDAGFSMIKGFDLPDGQPTDVTLASTLGGFKVLGITNNWAKALETNASSPFTDKCTSITFPDSYTVYADFWLCEGLTQLKTVKLGKNMTSIGMGAFSGCSGLTSITIPSGVTSIGDGAFSDCSGLTSITIPEGVTSIGTQAFCDCSGLTSITIPEGVTSIGSEVFSGCSGLTSINIPDGVTSIGEDAFADTYKLVEIINKSSVEITNESHGLNADRNPNIKILSSEEDSTLEQVGDFLFYNYNGTNYLVNYIGDEYFVTLPENYKGGSYEIRSYAIFGDANIVKVTIPSTVSGIGSYAVTNCQRLVEVVNKSQVSFPSGGYNYSPDRIITNEEESTVEKVDDYIFYKNGSVNYLVHYVGNETELVLPDNFKGEDYRIRQYTFQHCNWLTSIVIPEGVTSIGNSAFWGCSGLTSITIPEGVTSIGSSAFSYCSRLTSITIPSSVTSIEYSAFSGCSGLTSITIPEGVKSIGSQTFSDCSGLESIIVAEGNTVYTSRDNNGKECNAIISNNELIVGCKKTTIPEGVTSIGDCAFFGCSGLTSITIPSSVTSIGSFAFLGCSGLTSITIPSSVTSIEWNAFYNCNGLTNVYYTGSAEEWTTLLANVGSDNECLTGATIHYNYVG